MRLRSTCVVLAILLTSIGTAKSVVAQENPILEPDTRLRAWMRHPPSRVWVGDLVLLDHRYLELRIDTVIQLRLDRIDKLELSRGKSEWITVGIPMLGAALGAIIAPALMQESITCQAGGGSVTECGSEAPKPLIGAAVGGLAFMLVGNLLAEERWMELDIREYEGTVGVALGARVRFRVGR
jgi:hypothetical protein